MAITNGNGFDIKYNNTDVVYAARQVTILDNGWIVSVGGSVGSSTVVLVWSVSKDNGATWTQLCTSSENTTATWGFGLCSYGNMVYTVGISGNGGGVIYLYKINATTQTNVAITATTISSNGGYVGLCPSICADKVGALHVAFVGGSTGYNQIRYSKSTDGGTTWSAATTAFTGGYNTNYTDIVTDDNNYPKIAFMNGTSGGYYDYWVACWNGSSWVNTIVYDSSNNYKYFSLVYAKNRLTLIHLGPDNQAAYEVYENYSTDGGATWSVNRQISSTIAVNSGKVNATTDKNGNIYVYWTGSNGTTNALVYNKYTYATNTWGTEQLSSSNTTYNYRDPVVPAKVTNLLLWTFRRLSGSSFSYMQVDEILLGWGHKLMGVSTPSKVIGVSPTKVMGVA